MTINDVDNMTPKQSPLKPGQSRETKWRNGGQRKSPVQSSIERIAESPRPSPHQDDRSELSLPHLYNRQSRDLSTNISKCPSPEVGLQNQSTAHTHSSSDDRVLEDSEEVRTHFRVLMSWEADYLRGSKATRGPILYAMEKEPEQLHAIEA